MTPVKNQYVRVIFRNSSHVEGFVENWSAKQALLRSSDGKSILIIEDVASDIMAVKVWLEPMVQAPLVSPMIEDDYVQDIEQEFEEVKREDNIDAYLKAKTLIELRRLQAEQERKIVNNRLKDHVPTPMKATKYELPGFLKGK